MHYARGGSTRSCWALTLGIAYLLGLGRLENGLTYEVRQEYVYINANPGIFELDK